MHYIAFHFTVIPAQPGTEILMAIIADMGFESFNQEENGFTAYISEEKVKNLNLTDLEFADFTFSYTSEKIEQKNWNEEWERSFDPVRIGNELLIRAPFHAEDKSVKREIVIMPKMSFGTGHHQTTQLVCEAMLRMDFSGRRVLDMGCGTGVLAILAKKLGAAEILAIDIDEWSVENCRENCLNNHCGDIVVKRGDVDLISGEPPFDIILANINKNILRLHLSAYALKLKQQGILMLSGFFTTDVEELTTAARTCGLELLRHSAKQEWAMMELTKK